MRLFPVIARLGLAFLLVLGVQGPASAAVEIAFHSRELGGSFPHAFVRMTGTVDATGEPVDLAYGFTATADGWTIPDLDEARGVAIGSLEAIRARASAGGKAKAAKAAAAEATGQIEGHNF